MVTAGGEQVFSNLKAEMARRGLSGRKIAIGIGISGKAFSNKMIGKSEFTRVEMVKIQSVFFSDLTLDYLFELEEKHERHCK